MTGKPDAHSLFKGTAVPGEFRRLVSDPEAAEPEDAGCPAFGYLRGTRDRALTLEFRFRNGNSTYLPYALLGPWHFNPSVGLLLKFTSDVTTLVLIRGSNLDTLVNDSVNLTDRGIGRHRVLWVTEMDEGALRRAGGERPSIDRIEVAEFSSHDDALKWLRTVAPPFAP